MITIKRLGHVVLRVADTARSKAFYTRFLGLRVLEEDAADHNGAVFLGLRDEGNILDLIPDPGAPAKPASTPRFAGPLHHLAFELDSHQALNDAYFTLLDHDVKIVNIADHEVVESVYFSDPDGNLVEIYWTRPNANDLWNQGRDDVHQEPVFERRAG